MFLVIYVKAHLHRNTSSVEHAVVGKGAGKLGLQAASSIGGLGYSFSLFGRSFNIIGCQLFPSTEAKRYIKRNQCMGELVSELKTLPAICDFFEGIETDSLSEFAVIAGDLGYMLNSTYKDFKSHLVHPITQFKELD
jgi:hypothetical protein